MEEWEKRLEHQKAYRNLQCELLGIPIPTDDPAGGLKMVKEIYREFNGKKFWPRFKEMGHDAVAFEWCKCNRDQ